MTTLQHHVLGVLWCLHAVITVAASGTGHLPFLPDASPIAAPGTRQSAVCLNGAAACRKPRQDSIMMQLTHKIVPGRTKLVDEEGHSSYGASSIPVPVKHEVSEAPFEDVPLHAVASADWEASANDRSYLVLYIGGISIYVLLFLLGYLVHFDSPCQSTSQEASQPEKNIWLLALPMFLHLGLSYMPASPGIWSSLQHWAAAEPAFAMVAFGYASPVGTRPAYAAHLGISMVLLLANVPTTTAMIPGMMDIVLPLRSWHAIAFALACCELMRKPFDPLPCWMTPKHLFFVGWAVQLAGVVVDGQVFPTIFDPVIGLVCHVHLPEYLIGLSIRKWDTDAKPCMSGALVVLLLSIFLSVDPGSLHIFMFTAIHMTWPTSYQLGTWLVTPVFTLLIRALANPQDMLGVLVRHAAPIGAPFPVSAWVLVPLVPLLAIRVGLCSAALLVFAAGAGVDWLLRFAFRGRSVDVPPPALQGRCGTGASCNSGSWALKGLYYFAMVTCLVLYLVYFVGMKRRPILDVSPGQAPVYIQYFIWVVEMLVCISLPGLVPCILMHAMYPAPIYGKQPPIGEAPEDDIGADSFVMYFRYVTKGNNAQLVASNIRKSFAVLQSADMPHFERGAARNGPRWRLQVVTDRPIDLATNAPDVPAAEVVVPDSYKCPRGAKFKARALHYAVSVGADGLPTQARPDDWVVHLDEETFFDVRTVWACYRHAATESRAVAAGTKEYGSLGQGCIVYNTNGLGIVNLMTMFCDCCRVSDDYGKFRFCSVFLGKPAMGIHGSFIMIQQKVEEDAGFDYGYEGSITEDTYFAMMAWTKINIQLTWIDALMYEQSPFTITDLVKQRARWFHGIAYCCTSPEIATKCKVLLAAHWFCWLCCAAVMFSQVIFALAGASSFSMTILYALVCGSVFWCYTLGFVMTFNPADVGATHWLLMLFGVHMLLPVIGLIETAGVLHGFYLYLVRATQFHIVQKEQLTGKATTSRLTALCKLRRQPGDGPVEHKPVPTSSAKASEPNFQPLHQAIQELASRRPSQVALINEPRRMTFLEMDSAATAIALHATTNLGLAPRSRSPVGVCAEGAPFALAVVAVLKTGNPYVPLPPELPDERAEAIVEDAKVWLAIADAAGKRRAEAIFPTKGSIELIMVTCYPFVILGVESGSWASGSSGRGNRWGVRSDDPAVILHTSGSTGKPKGIVLSHGCVHNRFQWGWEAYPFADGEVTLARTTPTFADHLHEVLAGLSKGIPLVIMKDRSDTRELCHLVKAHSVSRLVLVPAFISLYLEALGAAFSDTFSSVRMWTASGEAMPMKLVRLLLSRVPAGTVLLNIYGSAEVAADVTCAEFHAKSLAAITDARSESFASIGKPIHNCAVHILNPDTLAEVPRGEVGEFFISGRCLGEGYLGLAQETAERFVELTHLGVARAFRTGDFGYEKEGGEFCYVGRRDQQVKIHGQRVEVLEVEHALNEAMAKLFVRGKSSPLEAVVVPITDGSTQDTHLVAFVSGWHGEADGLRAVDAALRLRLPGAWVPRLLPRLGALPRLPNGKLDRKTIRLEAEQHWNGEVESSDSFGIMRSALSGEKEARQTIHCGYSLGIVSVVMYHSLDCNPSEGCSGVQFAPHWVRTFVTQVLASNVWMFAFVIGGPVLHRMESRAVGRLALGQTEIVCLFLVFAMSWPLATLQRISQPWAEHYIAQGVHRWFLEMLLVARVFLVLAQHILQPATQVVILAAVVVISSNELCPRAPAPHSCQLYQFGLVEASHACMLDGKGEEFFTVFDRKFFIFTLLYVTFFHYGMDMVQELSWWSKQRVPALIAFVTSLAVLTQGAPMMNGVSENNGSLLQVVVELALGLATIGLMFALVTPWRPATLQWIGQRSLVAYVIHPYIVVRTQPWDPKQIMRRLGETNFSTITIGALDIAVILVYMLLIIGLSVFMVWVVKMCGAAARSLYRCAVKQ